MTTLAERIAGALQRAGLAEPVDFVDDIGDADSVAAIAAAAFNEWLREREASLEAELHRQSAAVSLCADNPQRGHHRNCKSKDAKAVIDALVRELEGEG